MAIRQVSKASRQCPTGIAGTENKRMGLGRQERLEKTQSHDVVDMGMAQKDIGGRRCRCAVAKLLSERNDPGSSIENQPVSGDRDFDAGGIAANGKGPRIGRRITSPHTPKPHSKERWWMLVARIDPVHRTLLLVRHDVKGGYWPIDSLETKLLDRLRFESIFQPAHSFLVSENLSAFRLGAQSRRQVWQIAHRTVIHSGFKAHSSKRRITGGDAH